MKIRRFRPSDTELIAQLFQNTIRSVNLGDYTEEQLKAWAPDDIHFRDWEEKCSSTSTLVADSNGIIAGFAQLDDDGHIDCFYCHKDFQRKGVGTMLFNEIEAEACNSGLTRLFVESSITAKTFFLKNGFSVIDKQNVKTRGVELTNFRMEKFL